jgi:hypothetical protein
VEAAVRRQAEIAEEAMHERVEAEEKARQLAVELDHVRAELLELQNQKRGWFRSR